MWALQAGAAFARQGPPVKRGAPLRRRGPLPRSTPLERGAPLRARRARPRRSERERDLPYLADVHRVGCYARVSVTGHRCDGPLEADHGGHRAAGRKANDDTCIALCRKAHRQRTDFAGPFRHLDQDAMRRWLDSGIQWTRAQVERLRAQRRTA
jgi:hypothetical protein